MDRKLLGVPVSVSTELPKSVRRRDVYLPCILRGSYILINLLGIGINYTSSNGGEGTHLSFEELTRRDSDPLSIRTAIVRRRFSKAGWQLTAPKSRHFNTLCLVQNRCLELLRHVKKRRSSLCDEL